MNRPFCQAILMPEQTQSGEASVAPAFSDAAGFQAWRETLPLTNVERCHAAVLGQVAALQRSPMPAGVRLELLELLRELAVPLQTERAGKYAGRPVPLDGQDRAAWESVAGLWSALAAGYDALIDAMAGEAPEIAAHAALICQRAIRCTGRAMLERNRVYRRIPGELWRQLHRLHEFAQSAGVESAVVHDAVGRESAATSCTAEYLHTVLLQLAQPDALTLRQIELIDLWLESWAPLVSLAPTPPTTGSIPPIALVAESDRGASLAGQQPPEAARFLRLEELNRALRLAATGLRQGQAPASLGLGDMARDECERLLLLLHVQWCAAGTGRADERSGEGITVTIAPNLSAIHYNLSGRPFRQPGGDITARERHEFDTLGFMAGTDPTVSQRSAAIESWVIVNKSASGFLSLCRDPGVATRIGHNQLLGLRNPTNKNLYLGTVQRLAMDDAGGIWVGLRLITASAQAVAARIPGARGALSIRYERALVVPADAARKIPASVLLLPGWFVAGRHIELYRDHPEQIELRELLDKGPNFERATFVTL